MATGQQNSIAIWVLTPNGLALARRIQQQWKGASLFLTQRLAEEDPTSESQVFERLTEAVEKQFSHFNGHIFIMATGIVVRTLTSLIEHKTVDPAVVVVDDQGQFAISLIAGHIGGANQLARQAAEILRATPVITTATDVNAKPAIDLLAAANGLKIENPSCIKGVNLALLNDEPVRVYDPAGWLGDNLPGSLTLTEDPGVASGPENGSHKSSVRVDDILLDPVTDVLVLRPPSLVAGIGCNRHTSKEEIGGLLDMVLEKFGLARNSLSCLASIDLKSDETGLLALAADMDLPLQFFTKAALSGVQGVQTPSATVAKHIGVPSVCEAAAILSSRYGRLIVPKHNTRNVTLAIARRACVLSASVRAV
jgi:cobalt-precorrin 5A hydrolase